MVLLIDVGNTRIKWALLDDGRLCATDAIEHSGRAMAIEQMLERVSIVPAGVVAANVAGDEWAAQITSAVRDKWSLPVVFAVTPARHGSVRNGYDDFTQLGIDRWLAMTAALDQFPGPLCIVDAGTAITIDVVAAGGNHQGGYILPGLDLMRRSLAEGTGDLRRLAGTEQQLADAPRAPGCSTRAAIDAGTLAAICGAIDYCCNDSAIVLTGGDAERLRHHLDVVAQHEPHLVLKGLALAAAELMGQAES